MGMEKEIKIELRIVEVTTDRLQLLAACSPEIGLSRLAERVTGGDLTLLEALADETSIGLAVVSVSETLHGRTLSLLHGVATNGVKGFSDLISPALEAVAKNSECRAVRVHSDRAGLDGICKKHGYEFAETIWTKNVN